MRNLTVRQMFMAIFLNAFCFDLDIQVETKPIEKECHKHLLYLEITHLSADLHEPCPVSTQLAVN